MPKPPDGRHSLPRLHDSASAASPGALPVCRVRFTAFALAEIACGPEQGVHLRGALGVHLRALECPSPDRDPCPHCDDRAPCSYRLAFSARAAADRDPPSARADGARPYFVRPQLGRTAVGPGQTFEFELWALGPLAPRLPDLVRALLPLQASGLGHRSAQFRLAHADFLDPIGEVIERVEHLQLLRDHAALGWLLEFPGVDRSEQLGEVELQFLTPTRLSHAGQPLPVPTLAAVVDAIGRRSRDLLTRWGLPEAPLHWPLHIRAELIDWSGAWRSMGRRSRSQLGSHHDLSGFVGQVRYRGYLAELVPWLRVAELLHIGSNIPFGCGQLKVAYRPLS
jgi:hypothetical protein